MVCLQHGDLTTSNRHSALGGLEKSMTRGRKDPSWWCYARSGGISEETVVPGFNKLEVTRLSSRLYHGHDCHIKGEDFNGRIISKVEVLRIHCWESHHQLGHLIVLNKPPYTFHSSTTGIRNQPKSGARSVCS